MVITKQIIIKSVNLLLFKIYKTPQLQKEFLHKRKLIF